METRHVRLEHSEALNAKKQLLSAELNLLHVIKRIRAYKLLRKKEFSLRRKIKSNLTSVKSRINLVISTFPKDAIKSPKKHKSARITVEKLVKEPRSDIQRELEEIKRKLARLE